MADYCALLKEKSFKYILTVYSVFLSFFGSKQVENNSFLMFFEKK